MRIDVRLHPAQGGNDRSVGHGDMMPGRDASRRSVGTIRSSSRPLSFSPPLITENFEVATKDQLS